MVWLNLSPSPVGVIGVLYLPEVDYYLPPRQLEETAHNGRSKVTWWGVGEKSIEWFTEDQAFLRSYDSAPRLPPSPPPLSVIKWPLFLSHPACRGSSLLTGEGGRRRGRSQIRRPRESLALYKSFNSNARYDMRLYIHFWLFLHAKEHCKWALIFAGSPLCKTPFFASFRFQPKTNSAPYLKRVKKLQIRRILLHSPPTSLLTRSRLLDQLYI
jgi:hypothetical protein